MNILAHAIDALEQSVVAGQEKEKPRHNLCPPLVPTALPGNVLLALPGDTADRF